MFHVYPVYSVLFVPSSLAITCWKRADFLVLSYVLFLVFLSLFQTLFQVRYGTSIHNICLPLYFLPIDTAIWALTRQNSIRTALVNSVESDLGCTSRIHFVHVTLALYKVTLTAQKPWQHNNKCDCSKINGYK